MATNKGAHRNMTCPKVSAKLVGYVQLASGYPSLLNHPLKSRDEGIKMALKTKLVTSCNQRGGLLRTAWDVRIRFLLHCHTGKRSEGEALSRGGALFCSAS